MAIVLCRKYHGQVGECPAATAETTDDAEPTTDKPSDALPAS